MTSLTTKQYPMFIGNDACAASNGAWIETINPSTGTVIGSFPAGTRDDVNRAVEAAENAFLTWRDIEPTERAAMIGSLADIISDHADELAALDSMENGSLLAEMRRDVDAALAHLRYFAGMALHLRGETVPSGKGTLNYSLRQPFGVVGRIIPFNHPFMFAASKIAAPLIAGNTVILKPSEYTSLSALRLAELAREILPAGVLNVVTGLGKDVGDALVAHPRVQRLAFTGSVETGMAIQRRAAEVGIKSISLELGGKNPLVIFPDADIEVAVNAAIRGMNFTWQGQSCGSLSRVVIHSTIYSEFVDLLSNRVASLHPGLPEASDSDTGAIVNEPQLQKVLSYVQLGLSEGAHLRTGGDRIADGDLGNGLFIRPAEIADVDPNSRLAQEEIFGPVLAAMRFSSEDEAISIANNTRYGLTASVFTQNLATAHRFAERVEAGYVWVNEVSRHVPGTPYGGFKDSGLGREEEFDELLSYTQVKSVHIKYSA